VGEVGGEVVVGVDEASMSAEMRGCRGAPPHPPCALACHTESPVSLVVVR